MKKYNVLFNQKLRRLKIYKPLLYALVLGLVFFFTLTTTFVFIITLWL